MKNKKNYLYALFALIVVAGISSYIFLAHLNKVDVQSDKHSAEASESITPPPSDLAPEIVKHEDLKPSPISQAAIASGKALHVPILMYHHIGVAPETADATHRGLTVSTKEFETEVKWLKDNHYSSVSFDDLYKKVKKESVNWPSKPVIFTFDDGYTDVFQNAVPILDKYGYKGTFAIITSFPGQTQGDNFYATWADIVAAKRDGMEIVCHTRDHFDGSSPKFDNAFILSNLSGCQSDLKIKAGTSLPYLVYPYGHYTESYISQALRAGFVMAFTTHEGSYVNTEDLMRIPRVRVNPNESMAKFIEKLNS